ncbi:hypothetical protein PR048_022892 [Dryococelus australis]|uniref:Integrase catalytic domain-containing protein n=1 Tax=Dryococelus australis TaxID=614101 RepID=A0ABQ9GSK9_9NEOP|nr:hypothetical protein PR048_022892 [Dryococelus australis]
MQNDVAKVVRSFLACQKAKHPTEHLRGELQSILPVRLLQLVSAVLSDKGTQFTNDVWLQGMLRLKIIPTTASVRYPQGNRVERQMRTLGTTLRMYWNNNQQKWMDYLPMIELIMKTRVTSFKALIGQHSKPLDISLLYLPDVCNENVSREEVQHEVQKLAKAHLFSAARKYKEKFKLSKLVKLEMEILVLAKTNHICKFWANLTKKLYNLYEGPYEICEVLKIQVTKECLGRYNVAALRLCHEPIILRAVLRREEVLTMQMQCGYLWWDGYTSTKIIFFNQNDAVLHGYGRPTCRKRLLTTPKRHSLSPTVVSVHADALLPGGELFHLSFTQPTPFSLPSVTYQPLSQIPIPPSTHSTPSQAWTAYPTPFFSTPSEASHCRFLFP